MDVRELDAVGTAAPEVPRKRYDAFISYAHDADGVFAPVVQRALQRLAKPWNRRRAMEVFRDETSLPVSSGMWPSIRAAIEELTTCHPPDRRPEAGLLGGVQPGWPHAGQQQL
jgi:hypothetical protein